MTSPRRPPKLLCIGDLVADVLASPVERLPQPGELSLTEKIAVFPGGNALNAAIAEQVAGRPFRPLNVPIRLSERPIFVG